MLLLNIGPAMPASERRALHALRRSRCATNFPHGALDGGLATDGASGLVRLWVPRRKRGWARLRRGSRLLVRRVLTVEPGDAASEHLVVSGGWLRDDHPAASAALLGEPACDLRAHALDPAPGELQLGCAGGRLDGAHVGGSFGARSVANGGRISSVTLGRNRPGAEGPPLLHPVLSSLSSSIGPGWRLTGRCVRSE